MYNTIYLRNESKVIFQSTIDKCFRLCIKKITESSKYFYILDKMQTYLRHIYFVDWRNLFFANWTFFNIALFHNIICTIFTTTDVIAGYKNLIRFSTNANGARTIRFHCSLTFFAHFPRKSFNLVIRDVTFYIISLIFIYSKW